MEWYWIVAICVGSLGLLILLSCLFYKKIFKRFYDIFLSFLAIIVFSPILLILMILGAIFMKGNPFFFQYRPGKKDKSGNERIFRLIKFRSMNNKKDENGNFLPDEQRLSKYGKFLRSTSLDELPELFNILIGDMSIIGPRPQLVRDMVFMSEEQRNRHNIRPGLSGLAQVKGRNNISWEQKFEYDIEYVKDGVNFFNDIKLILWTVLNVIKRSNIDREGTVSDIDFGDYLLTKGLITKETYDEKILQSKKLKTND